MTERMVGTIKRALQKMCWANMSDRDLSLDHVLYGYRQRSSTDGKSPFEVLYGFKYRFSEENETSILRRTKEAREF